MDRQSTALLIPPGTVSLPQTLEEVEALLSRREPSAPESSSTTLFLTVDVEDSYFDRPILMCGEGIGREFGVFGVLDEFDAYGLKGTFFVNVYEKDRHPEGVVEGVVREISARGHEVGLHTHPSAALDFYRRPLFRLSRSAQVDVLRWGAELIAEWTGMPPTSFRAGGYALNDDTFAALEEVGIAVDSSCFFPSPNNHNVRHTVNAVTRHDSTIEAPVTTVLRTSGNRTLEHRKLDLDWLSVADLQAALVALCLNGAGHATFMMHSFSFIEKRTRMPDEPRSPQARFVSEVHFDRYVEVYGPKPAMRDALSTFLEQVSTDPSLQVRTLREALRDGHLGSLGLEDVVPVVG